MKLTALFVVAFVACRPASITTGHLVEGTECGGGGQADVGGSPGMAGAGGDMGAGGEGGQGGAPDSAGGAAGSDSGGGGAVAQGGDAGGSAGSVGGQAGGMGGDRGLETLTTFRAYSIIEAPGALFITTSSGPGNLSVSQDDGHTWFTPGGFSSLTANAGRLNALDEVLVGTRTPGIWYCTGLTCTAATGVTGLGSSDNITDISEDIAGVVWAVNANSNTIHRSTDHGHSWTPVHAGFTTATMGHAWTVDYSTAYGVLIGGELGPVLQSTDDGVTWHTYGFVPPPTRGNIWIIRSSPIGTLYAAVQDPNPPARGSVSYHRATDASGVWHGVDAGGMANNWTNLSSFVFQADGSVISAGISSGAAVIWKTTTDGASWTRVGPSGLTAQPRVHLGRYSGCLYIAHGGGLLRNCGGY